MKSALVLTLAAFLASGPAFALDTPRPGAADPRIRTVDYDPQQVVRVVGVFRTATQIVLGPDETVLHAALGDATGWEVAPEKNIVFIKPKAKRPPTNLIVTAATAAGETRNYIFELTTRAGSTGRNAPDTFFVVRFRYPADERSRAVAAVSAAEAALQQKVLDLKLERGVLEGPRNLAYEVQGAVSVQPSEVSDNRRFTVLRFPAGQAVPTIYTVTADGTESLVAFDVRGEFVVIHATAKLFRLRRGKELLCIYNLANDPYGASFGTNTAAPDVDRTDKGVPKP
jgi:type IV secretion system protein VirB9